MHVYVTVYNNNAYNHILLCRFKMLPAWDVDFNVVDLHIKTESENSVIPIMNFTFG